MDMDKIDDIRKAMFDYHLPELPKEGYAFLELMKESFREQSESQSALNGEYPKYDMSGKAIEQLQNEKVIDLLVQNAAVEDVEPAQNPS